MPFLQPVPGVSGPASRFAAAGLRLGVPALGAGSDPPVFRSAMTDQHPERLAREHRLRSSVEINAVKAQGAVFRGRHCLLLALPLAAEVTRIGFIASKKSVGGAVQRNRARRRLR